MPTSPPTKLTQIQVDILYEILDRFDSVCTDANVDYVMCGGTALGAIRHKGLIPWDDDGDVFMFAPQFYNRSMELFTNAAARGLVIRPFIHGNTLDGIESDGWFKIYLGSHTLPNVDIFVLENQQTKWVHSDPKARTYFPNDYLTNEQLKLYRAPFGPLRLRMFSDHTPYFNRNYGDDWASIAWDGYDHVNEEWKPARSNERRVGDYRPALPSSKNVMHE
jgi:lipopolysaccharide cholinephosphotransferase